MPDSVPFISIIVAARPAEAEVKAVAAARLLDYPKDKLEIILARGKQPSIQRNLASKTAKGDWIYFLDDDSTPLPDVLKKALEHFKDPSVKMIGGPNLCPPEAPFIEQVFALVHASWLAFGPSRARYWGVGKSRATSEKELILCNLMIRRDTMLECGGFNEALYPNEENALMDEIQKRGGKLIYDPGFLVFRRPRSNVTAFCRMLQNYGRGRAEQFRLNPSTGSLANFVPPAFFAYVVVLMFINLFAPPAITMLCELPLVFYTLAVLIQTLFLIPMGGVAQSLAAMPFIILTHLLYGLGFWKGLGTTLKKDPKDLDAIRAAVKLEHPTV